MTRMGCLTDGITWQRKDDMFQKAPIQNCIGLLREAGSLHILKRPFPVAIWCGRGSGIMWSARMFKHFLA